MTTTDMPEKVHQGRAVKRIREILHVKQDVLADALGMSQQSISLLETKETIDPEVLEQIAKTLKVPVSAIKNFNEESAIYNIQNNYDNATPSYSFNNYCTFNPIDKWVEVIEENKKLYERLLQSEREKIVLLDKMLADKKK